MSLPNLTKTWQFRDPAACYICGSGSGVCAACRAEHLGGEAAEIRELVQALSSKPSPLFAPGFKQVDPKQEYDLECDRKAVEYAKSSGMTVLQGSPRQLLLDLDHDAACSQFRVARKMVDDKFGINAVTAWHSKSGAPHVHACVLLNQALSPMERVALEVALGSDPKRGVFCVLKHGQYGIEEPSLLFQPPNAKLKMNWDGNPWED